MNARQKKKKKITCQFSCEHKMRMELYEPNDIDTVVKLAVLHLTYYCNTKESGFNGTVMVEMVFFGRLTIEL